MGGAKALRTVAAVFVTGLMMGGCSGSSGSSASNDASMETPDGSATDSGRASVPGRDAASVDQKPDAGPPTDGGACAGLTCKAPAVCATDGKPHCSCPEGYDDTKGDGSQCDDRDECAEAKSGCDKHAKCTNTPGSWKCECETPAYVGDGKHCECGDGYTRDSEGLCLASDGLKCADNLDCMNGHCEGGTCCGHSCSTPGECHTTKGATCADGTTCAYPLADDGSPCDDTKACSAASSCQLGVCTTGTELTNCDDQNPCTDDSCQEPIGCKNQNNTAPCDDHDACTQVDQCQAGTCLGTSKDCTSSEDACNLGDCDPASGACIKRPKTVSAACNDGNSCTATDQCNAGTCVGTGNPCGANAVTCVPGTPNVCTCASGFVDNQAGACVPATDECAIATLCSPDATCVDPSNTAGDAVCTCKPGFAGNGQTCTAVDPCENNPCGAGRGTCVPGTAGTHTCTCNAGYISSGSNCVCDMSGTFATRTRLDIKWVTQGQVEGGADSTFSYAIERHTYDTQGNLMVELTECGETSLDICGLGVAPVLAAEAYSQFVPVETWGSGGLPLAKTKLALSNPVPGSPFVTDTVAALTGISLTDPFGPWPPSRRDIRGPGGAFDGTAVNGAAWLDQDNDAKVGITSYAVPPGGIKADNVPPDPIKDFGATSPVCPRMGGTHTPYAYWPAAPEGFSIMPIRIKRFYTASRVISALKGTINSCDDISGDVIGPNNGKPQLDGRTGGCLRMNGTGEVDCSATTVDFVDTTSADGQEIASATFKAKRVTTPVTCAMVRAVNYD
jgi:hypothetical protein